MNQGFARSVQLAGVNAHKAQIIGAVLSKAGMARHLVDVVHLAFEVHRQVWLNVARAIDRMIPSDEGIYHSLNRRPGDCYLA